MQLLVDFCNPNPCEHDGICTPVEGTDDGSVECECLDGYYGPTCEIGKEICCVLS